MRPSKREHVHFHKAHLQSLIAGILLLGLLAEDIIFGASSGCRLSLVKWNKGPSVLM